MAQQLKSVRMENGTCNLCRDENAWISIKILLKFVLKGPVNNIPSLVQIKAGRRPGYKPLFEPMMVSLLMKICINGPQWVNGVSHNIINSFSPGRCGLNPKLVTFKLIWRIDISSISGETALRWMPQDLTDD